MNPQDRFLFPEDTKVSENTKVSQKSRFSLEMILQGTGVSANSFDDETVYTASVLFDKLAKVHKKQSLEPEKHTTTTTATTNHALFPNLEKYLQPPIKPWK